MTDINDIKQQTPSQKQLQLLNRPWKISLISTIVAVAATAVLMLLTGNASGLRMGLAFAVVCSSIPAYFIGRWIVRYQHLIEVQNAALLTVNQQLTASNADLEAYAHTVAHDLKGPLANILGFASILKRQFENGHTADVLKIVAQIEKSSRNMDSIIQELLLLSQVRNEDVQTAVLDMTNLVSQAERRLTAMIEQSGGKIIYPAAWPPATGYAPWVEEVWVNYLSNGLKYGGAPPRLELGGAYQDNGFARFWVRDNGRGIAAADHALLFKEFTRLDKGNGDGHGLGLSIVSRIIEKLGGEVGLESHPGQGSLFYFTLPTNGLPEGNHSSWE